MSFQTSQIQIPYDVITIPVYDWSVFSIPEEQLQVFKYN